MEIFAETLEPLENQIKLCDNTSERFCAYVYKTCPMVLAHRLRRGLLYFLDGYYISNICSCQAKIECLFGFRWKIREKIKLPPC